MRRFVFLAVLCSLSLPVGLSITGCTHDYGQNYCSGYQSGPLVSATASIDLEPRTYGLSLSYGQIAQVQTPTAFNCKGASSGLTTFTYGISQPFPGSLYLADVSPTGKVCGGTWNRNSGNGVPDFTTCIPPLPGSQIYQANGGVAFLTASGGGVTSNPVPVFVHPPVTSVVLGGASSVHSCPNNPQTGSPTTVGVYSETSCVSQNQTAQLASTVYSDGQDITCNAGHLTYSSTNPNIVTIDQNGVATAHQPGSTVLTASVAQATSSAGYFFTCPPANITLRVGNTNLTSVVVNTNNIQPLTATVTDTLGNPITGLSLTYSSNDPINIPVSSSGAVKPSFPSDAAITVQCLPSICNPAPQDQIANLSTGLPITSNPVDIQTPGPSSNFLYLASPQSYNFVPIDFQTGTVGTPIRLPYQPNSMVMDENGNYLFFGSSNELMIASISATNGATLTTVAPQVPGTVLAVSPDDEQVLIHDPCRQLFYVYTPAIGNTGASSQSFGAPGPTIACDANNEPIDPSVEINPPYAAAFTQDSQTLYVVNDNVLYTYNRFTGWHTCTDNAQTGNCPINSHSVAVTIPGVGAYAAGSTTTAFGYCAIGFNNAGQSTNPPVGIDPNTAKNPTAYYPLADTVTDATDEIAGTTDGFHMIGASATGDNLTDIEVNIPSGSCPLKTALQFTHAAPQQYSLNTTNIASIDQVLVSPNSQLAYVTFLPTNVAAGGSTLPAYQIPCTATQTCPSGQATAGKIVNIPLKGSNLNPIAGTFSPDTTQFYVATSGDDAVHYINNSTLTDTSQINPGLTCGTTTTAPANPFFACTQGQAVPAFFLAAKPRPLQGTTAAAKSPAQ